MQYQSSIVLDLFRKFATIVLMSQSYVKSRFNHRSWRRFMFLCSWREKAVVVALDEDSIGSPFEMENIRGTLPRQRALLPITIDAINAVVRSMTVRGALDEYKGTLQLLDRSRNASGFESWLGGGLDRSIRWLTIPVRSMFLDDRLNNNNRVWVIVISRMTFAFIWINVI